MMYDDCMSEVSIANAWMARAASAASWASVRNKKIGDFLIGGDDRVVSVRWQVARTSPGEIPSWAEFEGDPNGTKKPIPRLYRRLGVVAFDRDALAASMDELDGPDVEPYDRVLPPLAVGWQLGKVVMVGVLPSSELRHGLPVRGRFGMRIGGGPLAVTMGRWHEGTRNLLVMPGAVTAIDSMPLAENTDNISIY
jgi:hypothetical protein